MPNYASITVVGHIGKDAAASKTQNGKDMVRFSVAFSTGWGEKKSTTWASCTWFGDRALKVAGYMTKGKPIMVIGEPSIRTYEKDGKTQASLDVIVREVVLLGGRDEAEPQAPAQQQQSFDCPPF